MFTGIVEEMGAIRSLTRAGKSAQIEIQCKLILEDLKIGDSVCTNGVCLTATKVTSQSFFADVMHETLRRSSLGSTGVGGKVNLERAMSANGRFGGHIVSGHIDGVGRIVSTKRDSNAVWYEIACDPQIMKYIVEKGSIAIDGISLTVAALTASTFSVSVIPHTAAITSLGQKSAGDVVNLENDIIGKYVERLLAAGTATAYAQDGQGGHGYGERGHGESEHGEQLGISDQGVPSASAGFSKSAGLSGQFGGSGDTRGISEAFLAENGFI